MRAEEAKIELELYRTDVPILERIQLAVSRFYGARRLDALPWLKAVFDAYLSFSGLQTGTAGQEQSDELDETRIISSDNLDFEYCSRAFMSGRCESAAGQSTVERLRDAPLIVNNFLLYLLRHNVLPELSSQLDAAIQIGRSASVQMSKNKLLSMNIPDDLGVALSSLFGGMYHGLPAKNPWLPDFKLPKYAERNAALAFVRQLLPMALDDTDALGAHQKRLAIVSIKQLMYANDTISFAITELWTPPEHSESDEEEASHAWAEMKVMLLTSSINQYCYIGQKIEATFIQPAIPGVDWWFVDNVTRTWPAYYIKC
ncbi:Argonaute siRNA chaperone complex subunit Arb1-domain-containing protein [Protomyces lactucae-debilis]|uniref:Argonaute siRNA chaperone complex subunit Arb1-domain-containing protein n=1 Tax=Protomyces lactucae-debilis TaxID=2754530 RepID=A0A1Y2FSS3_PROLT|nr:Argonaute siRNA chaperone complex subunit Arb1-domain-containing protein [Protomyces lactucae-debilis]ORY85765.1 Argonaute siRNA chaperone complex subunit Arb1-domain-containing protein [Protomyces lactucae-debilis]